MPDRVDTNDLKRTVLRNAIDAELHRQWTAEVGTPGYVKARWRDLATVLWSIGTAEGLEAFARTHKLETDVKAWARANALRGTDDR